MKKLNSLISKLQIATLIFVLSYTACNAQEQKTINLLPPQKEGGKPLMKVISERKSSRDFIDKALTDQQLSDLLWAAYGINRPDEKKRTAPSAHDKQEIDIYITIASGSYLYNAMNHSLIEISGEDIRSKTGKQDFVGTAALNIIYVLNKKKAASKNENEAITWASVATGAIVQNVYLFCASENLGCVVRGWVDKNIMASELKLTEEQAVIIAQTVGYIK